MATVHFILQGKGGAGKSFIAAILYQYFMVQGVHVCAFDTDPVNATLYSYDAFDHVVCIDIMNGNEVDASRFDEMMEKIITLPPETQVIVDNGSSSYLSICEYIKVNQGFDLLKDNDQKIFLHTVITGGSAMTESLGNFSSVVENYETPVVVWLNDFDGPIMVDGGDYQDLGAFEEFRQYIEAFIEIPHYDTLTRKDMIYMLTKRMSFEDYIKGKDGLMSRQRIRKLWRQIVETIEKTGVL